MILTSEKTPTRYPCWSCDVIVNMRHDADALVFVDTVVLKRWRRADVGIGWYYTRKGFAMSVFSETPRFRAESLSRNFVKWLKGQNAVTNVLGGRVRNRFLETRFRTLAFSRSEVGLIDR